MIFQYTFEKVLLNQKTQTRRIVKRNNLFFESAFELVDGSIHAVNRYREYVSEYVLGYPIREWQWLSTAYEVGKTYAVQPGRGKKAIGHIRTTAIRREDVRHISLEDIKAEGFDGYASFMHTWVLMHDKTIIPLLGEAHYNLSISDLVKERPTQLYDAWVLEFEVISDHSPTA